MTVKDPDLCAVGYVPMLRQHHAFVTISRNEHLARRAGTQDDNCDSEQKETFDQVIPLPEQRARKAFPCSV